MQKIFVRCITYWNPSAQLCRGEIKISFHVWSHYTQLSTDPGMHARILPWVKVLRSVDYMLNEMISSSRALKNSLISIGTKNMACLEKTTALL